MVYYKCLNPKCHAVLREEWVGNQEVCVYCKGKVKTWCADFPTQTCAEWTARMADMPCYKPAEPFYDYCLNMDAPVKRYDCDKCVRERGLRDYIE